MKMKNLKLFLKSILSFAVFGLVVNKFFWRFETDLDHTKFHEVYRKAIDLTATEEPLDIFELDQTDPRLIKYLRDHVLKQPTGKEYSLSEPHRLDASQLKQGVALDILLGKKKNGTFLEAGAYDGEEFSNSLIMELKHGWTGLLIEPLPGQFLRLLSKNRRVQAAQCCLSHTTKPTQVTFRINDMMSQIVEVHNHTTTTTSTTTTTTAKPNQKNQKEPKNQISQTNHQKNYIIITCYPLYSLLAAAKLTTIDLISLDLESSEVKVIQTIPWDKVNIKAMIIEINHIPEGPAYLETILMAQNYTLMQILDIDNIYVKKTA